MSELSPGAQRARDSASAMAGAGPISARNLAESLLLDRDGLAFRLVTDLGLRVDDWLGSTPISTEPDGETRAFRVARSLARQYFADPTVTSELLVLALLQTEPRLAREWADFGLKVEEVERRVLGDALDPIPVESDAVREALRPKESARTYRILDANVNRASEALRVLEDYARFTLNDATICSELKALRHDFAAGLSRLDADALRASRNTPGDVGTDVTTSREMSRADLGHVVTANARRLQESLRSLEEYGKLVDPEFAARCEQIRYRVYSIESCLQNNAWAKLARSRLCLLVSPAMATETLIREAVAGGVDMIQLRDKELDDRELVTRATQLRHLTRQLGALFIVNDRVDIAAVCQADGVHLGQTDLGVASARSILGPRPLIGVSTHNLDQVRQAVIDGASYIGVGPTFPSITKSFPHFAGVDFVREVHAATSLPAFAIGGITANNVDQVVAAGAIRIAVSSAITSAAEPKAAAQAILRQLPTR